MAEILFVAAEQVINHTNGGFGYQVDRCKLAVGKPDCRTDAA